MCSVESRNSMHKSIKRAHEKKHIAQLNVYCIWQINKPVKSHNYSKGITHHLGLADGRFCHKMPYKVNNHELEISQSVLARPTDIM